VLQPRLEAGRLLEQGVLADMRGEPSAESLDGALKKLKQSRSNMDVFETRIKELRRIYNNNRVIPEYEIALRRILKNHGPLERVALSDVRYSNIARGTAKPEIRKPIGSNMDEILAHIQADLSVVRTQLDQTIDAFETVLPMADQGGFAAMVLSGRAPFPEKIMQSADLIMVYAQFYNRACQATIAADMQTYPKGLEWLKKPSKNWQELERKGKSGANTQ
jgi:hypothetical protein